MTKVIIYGIGGFCENCQNNHDHPQNNIVEQYELPEPEQTTEQLNRQSAIDKLKILGLTDEEIEVLLSSV
jgi:hypothetical protein